MGLYQYTQQRECLYHGEGSAAQLIYLIFNGIHDQAPVTFPIRLRALSVIQSLRLLLDLEDRGVKSAKSAVLIHLNKDIAALSTVRFRKRRNVTNIIAHF